MYFDILTNVRKYRGTLTFAKNAELIRALPLEEAQEIICAWLQSVEDNPPVDFEMVRCAPWVCRSIPNLDELIMEWIKLRPIELRYEIGLRFLAGCWGGNHVVSETCLEFVTCAIDNSLERQTDAYAFALRALGIVADPVHDMNVTIAKRRELSEKLLTHLPAFEKQDRYPDIVKSLESLKDFETRKFFAIFDNAKDMDMSRLEGYKRAEIVDALLKWFDMINMRPKTAGLDCETMSYAGRFIGYALGEELVQTICDWMQESPNYRRYEVATTFLGGYWRMVGAENPDCEEKLRTILLRNSPGAAN